MYGTTGTNTAKNWKSSDGKRFSNKVFRRIGSIEKTADHQYMLRVMKYL
jgi:hypothetical protein